MSENSNLQNNFDPDLPNNEIISFAPEISEKEVHINFNPTLCGFATIQIDSHPFFSRLGKDAFNEQIREINFTIHRSFAEKKRIEIGSHFALQKLLLKITLATMTIVYLTFAFLLESGFASVRYAVMDYVWIPSLIGAILCVVFFFMLISVIFAPPPFFDFTEVRKVQVRQKIKEVNSGVNWINVGYTWVYDKDADKIIIKR